MIGFSRRTIFAVLALGVAIYLGVYSIMISSASYKAAKEFLESSEELRNAIGPVSNVSLGFMARASAKSRATRSEASYELGVVGASGEGKVKVDLVSQNQGWEVINAVLSTNNSRVIVLKENNP